MSFGNFKRRLPKGGGSHEPRASTSGATPGSAKQPTGRRMPVRRVNGHGASGGDGDDPNDDERSPRDRYQLIKFELDALEPWQIVKVVATYLSSEEDPTRFDIWLHEAQGYWACPVCHQRLASIGHTRTRVFRDTTRVPETNVFVRIPIVNCPTNGTREVRVPWTEKTDKWRYLRDLED